MFEYYHTRVWNYSHIDWYIENGIEIIKFKNFIDTEDLENFKIVELPVSSITDILNEKYGKGNWVIK